MSFLKSNFLFASGTFLSRVSGLLRVSIMSGIFGASAHLDAFLLANRIPNLFRELLAEGALGASFLRVYSRLKKTAKGEAEQLFKDVMSLFSIFMVVFCALGVWGAPLWVHLLTVWSGEKTELIQETIGLTQVLFPFIGLMTLGSIASGVLHYQGRFFLSAVSSTMLNVGYILGAVLLAPAMQAQFGVRLGNMDSGVLGLAFGVLLGGLLQTGIQLWPNRHMLHGFTRFRFSTDVKDVLRLMVPMVIAGSSAQVNVLVSTNFATTLETGTISWLNFAFTLYQLPVGLFAVGLGVAVIPKFTPVFLEFTNRFNQMQSSRTEEVVEITIWFLLPCLCFFLVSYQPLVTLFFKHGQFNAHDLASTSNCLWAYSFGLIGYGLTKVITSVYYVLNRTNFAMIVSLISLVVNYLSVSLLIEHFDYLSLPLTSTIVVSINALLLLLGLYRMGFRFSWRFWRRILFMLASAYVSVRLGAQVQSLVTLPQLHYKLEAMIQLAVAGSLILSVFGLFAVARKI